MIAIESPTYFGVLQIIESFGMKAVEIPTHPRNGMDLDALSIAIRQHGVKACISEHGAGYVLIDGKNVYGLSDQKAPEAFAAKKVTIAGTLDAKGKTITVQSITAAK